LLGGLSERERGRENSEYGGYSRCFQDFLPGQRPRRPT
jgi:hypothetical protein